MNMVLQKRPGQDADAGDEVFPVLGILQDPLAFDPSNHHRVQGLIARWIPLTRMPSLSVGTPWRHYLRQEPGAVVAHAGICAGGAGQLASLPRPIPELPIGSQCDKVYGKRG